MYTVDRYSIIFSFSLSIIFSIQKSDPHTHSKLLMHIYIHLCINHDDVISNFSIGSINYVLCILYSGLTNYTLYINKNISINVCIVYGTCSIVQLKLVCFSILNFFHCFRVLDSLFIFIFIFITYIFISTVFFYESTV